jgi:hypothetical protein
VLTTSAKIQAFFEACRQQPQQQHVKGVGHGGGFSTAASVVEKQPPSSISPSLSGYSIATSATLGAINVMNRFFSPNCFFF